VDLHLHCIQKGIGLPPSYEILTVWWIQQVYCISTIDRNSGPLAAAGPSPVEHGLVRFGADCDATAGPLLYFLHSQCGGLLTMREDVEWERSAGLQPEQAALISRRHLAILSD
jgi:hypothetical protein